MLLSRGGIMTGATDGALIEVVAQVCLLRRSQPSVERYAVRQALMDLFEAMSWTEEDADRLIDRALELGMVVQYGTMLEVP
jgi:hypothetical protein